MSAFTGVSAVVGGAGRREAEEFARLLESGRVPPEHGLADLVALARSLAPADHAPSPGFRAALREQLVAEAAARPAQVPAPRSAEPSDAPRRVRLRSAVAALAVASVVAGTGAAVASTRALPGDVLYGLKRQIENVQLALAGSDLERGRELLEQADNRLTEAERLAASGESSEPATRRALATTLDEMRTTTEAGATALTDSYRETGDEEPMRLLDRFVTDQRQRLEELYDLLDPSLRARVVALTDQLARVGAQARAVLSSATAGTAAAAGRAAGDGWAVSRVSDFAAAADAGGSAVAGLAGDQLGSAGGGVAGTAGGGGTGSAGGGAGGVLDDVVDGLGGGSTSGGKPGTSPLPVDPLPNATSAPLPSAVTSPLPDVTAPLPDVTAPLPDTSEPLPQVSDPLPSPPAPLPSVSACVPVPPLTTC